MVRSSAPKMTASSAQNCVKDSTSVVDDEHQEQSRHHDRSPLSESATCCRALIKFSGDEADDVSGDGDAKSASPTKSHFFVYCAKPCEAVCAAKLRVRCPTCGLGTFILDREPSCWADVLESRRIPGHCVSAECTTAKWAEFYFKCAAHRTEVQEAESTRAPPLEHVVNNFVCVPCLACTDIADIVLRFPCTSGHVICLDCFALYCRTRLNERRFVYDKQYGYTLPCPAGCERSLIRDAHHFRLLEGAAEYARYQRFAAEAYVLEGGGVLCPRPGCGAGIMLDENSDCNKVICSRQEGHGCGFVFCRLCLEGYHIGPCRDPGVLGVDMDSEQEENGGRLSSFDIDNDRAQGSRWDTASDLTIRGTTKPCPKCRTPTEKAGGCMHMLCERPHCGFQWCWVCQTEWSRGCQGDHWFG